MSINCREDLLNRQAKVNEEIKSYTCRVLVCSGTGFLHPYCYLGFITSVYCDCTNLVFLLSYD